MSILLMSNESLKSTVTEGDVMKIHILLAKIDMKRKYYDYQIIHMEGMC